MLLRLGGAEGYEASATEAKHPPLEPIDLTDLPTRKTWLTIGQFLTVEELDDLIKKDVHVEIIGC